MAVDTHMRTRFGGSTIATTVGAAVVQNKVDGLIYEYACHEGNYGLANTLRSARVAEKAAQTPK